MVIATVSTAGVLHAWPIALARADRLTLQVPVFTRQRLTATARLGERDALVVGVLPGREPGTVTMLFVESSVIDPVVAAENAGFALR